jgi:hypothetical protein
LALSAFVIAAAWFVALPVPAQKNTFEPDLAKLVEGKGWRVYNRSVSLLNEGSRKGVRFDERSGVGIGWVEGYEFANRTIELDIRGKDVLQRSFVGIAFHGLDDQTYDAVYLRPFNFRAEDSVRRAHAVQYISHPIYTWQKLRAEHAGVYERPIQPPPDPNAWVHVRVVVNSPNVSVFINDAKEPSLAVKQLSSRMKGRIGLWMGEGSGGDFANFRIIPAG